MRRDGAVAEADVVLIVGVRENPRRWYAGGKHGKVFGTGGDVLSLSSLAPQLEAALRALLELGRPLQAAFDAESEAALTRAVKEEAAPSARLQALLAADAARTLLHDGQVAAGLVRRCAAKFERAALEYNQFLLFSDDHREELVEIYEAFVDDLREQLDVLRGDDEALSALQEAVVDHHVALWQFGRAFVKSQFAVDESVPGPIPPCFEYDPEFQLKLWGIPPEKVRERLVEPVLDLGCGQQAALVRWLRERGVDAYGVDKLAEPGEFVQQGDWLDTPLEPGRWGTIISHMGFSNHFFHHHLRTDGHPERYARRFMDILRALKPGGRFLYAPGLPFFEPLLPEGWVEVVTRPIDVDPDVVGLLDGKDLPDGEEAALRNGTVHSQEPPSSERSGSRRRSGTEASAGAPDAHRRPGLYATEVRVLRNE